ncbi:MAG: MATE family efflux transporter [Chitinophagales bacterium]|nr:MATE family efflux transporter [Bacteroidota bacterium]MCB9042153.1 MATE family efflux transporter [Chitinophagales bacterium]
MEIKPTIKNLLSIALPLMAFQFVQNIIGFTDTIFLGRVGLVEFSACGIVSLYYLIMVMLGLGCSRGAQILIARMAGAKKYSEIGTLFDNFVYLMAFLGIFLFVVLYFLSPYVLPFFIQEESILQAGLSYLKYRSWGIFFSLAALILLALYAGLGKTRIILWVTLILASVNIVLNYGLIFGKFGLPAMGIAGAGLASTISEAVSSGIGFLYLIFDPFLKPIKIFKMRSINRTYMRDLSNISLPLILQYFVGMGGWFMLFTFIENMGNTALGVSIIARWVYTFWGIPIWSLASAVNSSVSHLLGKNNFGDAMKSLRNALILSVSITAVLALCLWIFSEPIAYIFTNDAHLATAAQPLLHLLVIILMICAVSTIMFNAIIGSGATNVSFLIELVAVVFYISYAYLSVNVWHLQLRSVWLAELIYWAILLVCSIYYLQKMNKKHAASL